MSQVLKTELAAQSSFSKAQALPAVTGLNKTLRDLSAPFEDETAGNKKVIPIVPRYQDIFSDKASTDTYVIEGDSLVLDAITHDDVEWGSFPGPQSLHVVYLVERLLERLLPLGPQPSIVFFSCHAGIYAHLDQRVRQQAIFLRQTLVRHLMTNQKAVPVVVLPNWWGKQWDEYLAVHNPSFLMGHTDPLAAAALIYERAGIAGQDLPEAFHALDAFYFDLLFRLSRSYWAIQCMNLKSRSAFTFALHPPRHTELAARYKAIHPTIIRVMSQVTPADVPLSPEATLSSAFAPNVSRPVVLRAAVAACSALLSRPPTGLDRETLLGLVKLELVAATVQSELDISGRAFDIPEELVVIPPVFTSALLSEFTSVLADVHDLTNTAAIIDLFDGRVLHAVASAARAFQASSLETLGFTPGMTESLQSAWTHVAGAAPLFPIAVPSSLQVAPRPATKSRALKKPEMIRIRENELLRPFFGDEFDEIETIDREDGPTAQLRIQGDEDPEAVEVSDKKHRKQAVTQRTWAHYERYAHALEDGPSFSMQRLINVKTGEKGEAHIAVSAEGAVRRVVEELNKRRVPEDLRSGKFTRASAGIAEVVETTRDPVARSRLAVLTLFAQMGCHLQRTLKQPKEAFELAENLYDNLGGLMTEEDKQELGRVLSWFQLDKYYELFETIRTRHTRKSDVPTVLDAALANLTVAADDDETLAQWGREAQDRLRLDLESQLAILLEDHSAAAAIATPPTKSSKSLDASSDEDEGAKIKNRAVATFRRKINDLGKMSDKFRECDRVVKESRDPRLVRHAYVTKLNLITDEFNRCKTEHVERSDILKNEAYALAHKIFELDISIVEDSEFSADIKADLRQLGLVSLTSYAVEKNRLAAAARAQQESELSKTKGSIRGSVGDGHDLDALFEEEDESGETTFPTFFSKYATIFMDKEKEKEKEKPGKKQAAGKKEIVAKKGGKAAAPAGPMKDVDYRVKIEALIREADYQEAYSLLEKHEEFVSKEKALKPEQVKAMHIQDRMMRLRLLAELQLAQAQPTYQSCLNTSLDLISEFKDAMVGRQLSTLSNVVDSIDFRAYISRLIAHRESLLAAAAKYAKGPPAATAHVDSPADEKKPKKSAKSAPARATAASGTSSRGGSSSTAIVDINDLRAKDIEYQLSNLVKEMERGVDLIPDPRVPFTVERWQANLMNLVDCNKTVLVSAPTSAGKTFISYYTINHVISQSDNDVVIYVAPTRALIDQAVAEIYRRFKKNYDYPEKTLLGVFYTGRVLDALRAQVLVTDPTHLEMLLLSPKYSSWASRIKYIIFDEIHQMNASNQTTTFGSFVWEHLLILIRCPFIALSATLGNMDDLSSYLKKVTDQVEANRWAEPIKHDERYSDLKYHLFVAEQKGQKKKLLTPTPADVEMDWSDEGSGSESESESSSGSDSDSETPAGPKFKARIQPLTAMSMCNVHQIADRVAAGKEPFPRDLVLMPEDALNLYKALVSVAKANPSTPGLDMSFIDRFNPANWFKNDFTIKRSHVRNYEQKTKEEKMGLKPDQGARLKELVAEWCSSPTLCPLAQKALASLRKPFDDGFTAMEASWSSIDFDFAKSTFFELIKMIHKRNQLPALVFNMDPDCCYELFEAIRPLVRRIPLAPIPVLTNEGESEDQEGMPGGDEDRMADKVAAKGKQQAGKNAPRYSKAEIAENRQQLEERRAEDEAEKLKYDLFGNVDGNQIDESEIKELHETLVAKISHRSSKRRVEENRQKVEDGGKALAKLRKDEEELENAIAQLSTAYKRPGVEKELADKRQELAALRNTIKRTQQEVRDCEGKIRSAASDSLNVSRQLELIDTLIDGLYRGIAVHYRGTPKLLPDYRHAVERFFRLRKIRVVISTQTLALGINMPCRAVVFAGDSELLNATQFRQMAGRAGRRGFDNIGSVIFSGMPEDKIRRLITSDIPNLRAQLSLRPALLLQLCHQVTAVATAHGALGHARSCARRLLELTFYSPNMDERLFALNQLQLKFQARFTVEFLISEGFMNPDGRLTPLGSLALFLKEVEPSNYLLAALIRDQIFSKCDSNDLLKHNLISIISNFAFRVPLYESRLGIASGMRKLEALPPIFQEALSAFEQKALLNFSLGVRDFAVAAREQLPPCVSLPLSSVSFGSKWRGPARPRPVPAAAAQIAPVAAQPQVQTSTAPQTSWDAEPQAPQQAAVVAAPAPAPVVAAAPAPTGPAPSLAGKLLSRRIRADARSPFSAMTGKSDYFSTVGELAESIRSDILFDQDVVPALTLSGPNEPVCAFIADFFQHSDFEKMRDAYGIDKREAADILEDFSRVVKKLNEFLRGSQLADIEVLFALQNIHEELTDKLKRAGLKKLTAGATSSSQA